MPAVVIDSQTGEAVSYAASVRDVADPVPAGLTSVVVAKLPEPGRSRWDAATRAVVTLTDAERAELPENRRAAARARAADKGAPPAARIDALLELFEP